VSDKHVKSKVLGLGRQLSSLHLDMVVSQVQDNMGLVNMSDLKYLDLTVSQVQGNACLVNMPNPRFLQLGSLRSPK